jgi:hypothetical protein
MAWCLSLILSSTLLQASGSEGRDYYRFLVLIELVAWRLGIFRFGGTTIVAAGILVVLAGCVVLAIQLARISSSSAGQRSRRSSKRHR